MTNIEQMKKIVQSLGNKFGYDEKYWAIVDSVDTNTVVGTDGFLSIAVSTNKDVQDKPKFLELMYKDIYDKIRSDNFEPVDEFHAGIAGRVKQHTEPPKVDIIFEEVLDDVYIVVYTDELMVHALAEVKGVKK
jgi:hypothetical protein